MTLYILEYNNYYNRLVKQEESLEAYQQYIIYDLISTNFNPADKVNTQHVIGNGDYDGKGDYVIAVDEDGDIVSRWFIVDATRTRAGQWQLTLHRDLVVDYYNIIAESPMFIEKATLGDGDPLIFNTENMTVNQIKQSETLLKDETNCAWVVGYMSSKPNVDGEGHEENIVSKIQYHLPVDEAYASKANYPFFKYSNLESASNRQSLVANPTNRKVCVYFKLASSGGLYQGQKFAFNASGAQDTGILGETGYSRVFPYNWLSALKDDDFQCPREGSNMIWQNSLATNQSSFRSSYTMLEYLQKGFSGKYNEMWNMLDTQLGTVSPQTILAENGKKIYFQDTNEYYSVKVTQNDSGWDEVVPNYNSNLWLKMKAGYDAAKAAYNADPDYPYSYPTWEDFTGITADPNSYSFSINFTATTYTIQLDKVPEPALTYEVQIDNKRWHLNDAPYDMFCIPYSDDLILNNGGNFFCRANKELAFQTALALSRDYMGAGYVYDVQLLPYCPVRECIQSDGTFDVQNANHYEIKSYTESQSYINGTVVGTVLFSTRSNFTLDIPVSIPVTNKKIQANCDTWRLCSPNYSGLFEFNVAKNDGLDFVNIDCTYKPYNPYIHINPNFKNLYGSDFNDVRGLVCGGDFSLPATTDAWRTYELNNKNYQNIFDRNIQSMELRNSIQGNMDIFNAVTGTITGGAAGAASGAMIGGPWGALAGGIIGTGTALAGGIADVSTNKMLRNDALDLTKDQFGYQLGNVQALPYSLAKTSAFTANNKIWPFIEYYSCTVTEKVALANKIAYNGMTVMRIGKMSEFVGNTWEYNTIKSKGYIKGKLIRFNNEEEGFHVINSIADELFKGVYIE